MNIGLVLPNKTVLAALTFEFLDFRRNSSERIRESKRISSFPFMWRQACRALHAVLVVSCGREHDDRELSKGYNSGRA